MHTYTVAVASAATLTCSQRIELEVRFARELERILGGEDAVVDAYSAALQVERAGVQAQTIMSAERWVKAIEVASATARKMVSSETEITFAVRLDTGRAGVGVPA